MTSYNTFTPLVVVDSQCVGRLALSFRISDQKALTPCALSAFRAKHNSSQRKRARSPHMKTWAAFRVPFRRVSGPIQAHCHPSRPIWNLRSIQEHYSFWHRG
jgi:hypothetical protein